MRSSRIGSVVLVLAIAALAPEAFAETAPPPPEEPPSSPPPAEQAPAAPPAPAPPPVPPPPPPPAPAAPSARSQRGAPRVHIEANQPGVRLLRIERVISNEAGEGMLVRTACDAPCDKIVDGRRGQTFFLGASGMVPSRGFKLAGIEGDVVARVSGGNFAARQVGFLLGGFGGAAMIGGAIMLGFGYGATGTTLSADGKVVEGENTGLTTGGFVALGVGTAMVATAIILVATNRTSVELVPASARSAGLRLEMGALRF